MMPDFFDDLLEDRLQLIVGARAAEVLAVMRAASERAGFPLSRILSREKNALIDPARFEIYEGLRALGLSFPIIGKICQRDHTTVMHGIKRAAERRAA